MSLQVIADTWNNLIESGDARSNQLPLIKDPTIVIGMSIAYLIIVKYGPRFMEKREAFDLRRVLVAYNLFSVALSLYMLWEYMACSFFNPRFNLTYEPFDDTDTSYMTMRLVNIHWLYFASKIIEFFDTFVFILRKKNNQISFLHVYHHASMLFLQWSMVKFIPGGASYFGPLCNAFIHAVMYTYYGLAAIGPSMQKYLWWKRYLTRMQILQFILIFTYCTNLVSLQLRGVYGFFSWLKWSYMITLICLFSHFYINAYSKGKTSESSNVIQTPSTKNKDD